MCVLNRERRDGADKCFLLYDVFSRRPFRKIGKLDYDAVDSESEQSESGRAGKLRRPAQEEEAQYQSDAFDVDPDARALVYAYGRTLKVQSIRLPASIKRHMAPRFLIADYKYSPARIQEVKQAMKKKINRDLKNYFELGGAETCATASPKKQAILQLLTFKYSSMCLNKRII